MMDYYNAKGTTLEHNHDLGIETKGKPEDFCTVIDVANEQLVTEGLLQHFPEHKVIGEESVGTGGIPPLTREPTWIVDPIDGTTNFASGLPLSCVSLGLCVEGEAVVGVVFAPMTEEVYLAVKGHGAFRNGVRLTPQPAKTLEESVVGCEYGYARGKENIEKMSMATRRVMEHGCRTLRILGSGVLDLCYVATGRLDVIYAGVATEGWKPWDYCAGVVVAQENGCAVEAIDQAPGAPFDLYSKSIICAVDRTLLDETRKVVIGK